MNGSDVQSRKFSVKRLWPLALLAIGAALFFALDLDRYFTFEMLRTNRELLVDFVSEHAVWAALVYIGLYVANTAFSLPSATLLTLVGGFLFGAVVATAYTVIGATIGATVVFLIAKTSLGDQLRARTGGALKKMEEGFRANALSYMLVLRLIPLFPFFVVNLVPAFLGVRPRIFVIGTFLGIIPGTFVYSLAGEGLGSLLAAGEEFSAGSVLTPQVIGAFVGLAVLSLLPVVYKKIKARKSRVP
jgi:uncharacterized membrane protein YdjX (TVP38/TMEM64 family)